MAWLTDHLANAHGGVTRVPTIPDFIRPSPPKQSRATSDFLSHDSKSIITHQITRILFCYFYCVSYFLYAAIICTIFLNLSLASPCEPYIQGAFKTTNTTHAAYEPRYTFSFSIIIFLVFWLFMNTFIIIYLTFSIKYWPCEAKTLD